MYTLIPLPCYFRFLSFLGVKSTRAFFVVTKATGGSKKRSFDEKSMGKKSKNAGTEPFESQKSAEKGKKRRETAPFWANVP